MIGPSGANSSRETSDNRSVKRKVFEDLDIESLCEEVCQSGRKRYLQETPVDSSQLIADGDLFSPVSGQEATEDRPVARLEVLLVDGTNCTWTTMSEMEQSGLEFAATGGRREDFQFWEQSNVQEKANVATANDNQQLEEEQEDGNLSWLLDFKLDPFIEAADDRVVGGSSMKECHYGSKNKLNGRTTVSDLKKTTYNNHENNPILQSHQNSNYSAVESSSNRNFAAPRCNGPKKPPFTYTELIEHALQERGELTVSAIYQWISEHFPYYKSNDDRWKNSVRHNLSINPHFRKGSKAPHGAGHLWAIANRGDSRPRQILTPVTQNSTRQVESTKDNNSRSTGNLFNQVIPIDEVEAATASIIQQTEDETEHIVNSVTLEHCAEQILSGIKKEVEVQYLVPMMVPNSEHHSTQQNEQTVQTGLHCPTKESDFLNPVSKEVVAEECGLISEGYLVTDLNPTTLGLNMVEPEIITPENLFGEELSFQFYELASPSQLQSA